MVHHARTASWVALAAATALVLSGCAGGGTGGDPTDVDPEGEVTPREISWLLSRPADGGGITAMPKVAAEYSAVYSGSWIKTAAAVPARPN